MTGALQRYARRMWRGEAGGIGVLLSVCLLPLEAVWRLVTAVRNRRYDRTGGASVGGVSVLSVGNLAVGGTGKTPVASWIVARLLEMQRQPAILHGGYGRDEPLLHRRWTPHVPVIVGADRLEGARDAHAQGADVAVMDDGFQHRRLARALDLVILSVDDRFPGPVLPRGPYREGASALERADGLVLTRRGASAEDARVFAGRLASIVPGTPVLGCLHFESTGLVRLGDGGAIVPDAAATLVLTAVGNPDSVRESVEMALPGAVDLVAFPDHHEFTHSDVAAARQRAGDRAIVVTEKDAVKLEAHTAVLGTCYVVKQRVVWDWGEAEVLSAIEAAIGRPGPDPRGVRA